MTDHSLAVSPQSPMQFLSVAEVRHQVNVIQDLMRSIMQKDVHYGVIPGCGDKPALLKPGAEKICLVFGLVPSFEITARELEGGHREYETTCTLRHRQSGQVVGQGVGVCSTKESKYRYRWDNTGRPVPPEYWETRNPDLLGGPSFAPRKKDGAWVIFQRVEHSDPADYYNTCKKVSKKRAHVDATLTATAASDIFDQDTVDEDGEVLIVPDHGESAASAPPPPAAPPKPMPQRKSAAPAASKPAQASNGGRWQGRIVTVGVKRRGTTKDGKAYTIHTVVGEDGASFDTFSDTVADTCSSLSQQGAEAVITYESDQYGKKIKTCEPAPTEQREPGQEG